MTQLHYQLVPRNESTDILKKEKERDYQSRGIPSIFFFISVSGIAMGTRSSAKVDPAWGTYVRTYIRS